MTREVTPAILQEFLDYNGATGTLIWKPRDRRHFTSDWQFAVWHKKYEGKEAFTAVSACGYKAGVLWRKGLLAHRVAWAVAHGEWPPQDIDHINHDRTDNRLVNLRCVSRAENCRNRAKPRNSLTRRVGVQWHKAIGKWCAVGSLQGKTHYLGSFSSYADACSERARFEHENGYHPNHGLVAA